MRVPRIRGGKSTESPILTLEHGVQRAGQLEPSEADGVVLFNCWSWYTQRTSGFFEATVPDTFFNGTVL